METENGKIGNAVTRMSNFEVNFGAEKIAYQFYYKIKTFASYSEPLVSIANLCKYCFMLTQYSPTLSCWRTPRTSLLFFYFTNCT